MGKQWSFLILTSCLTMAQWHYTAKCFQRMASCWLTLSVQVVQTGLPSRFESAGENSHMENDEGEEGECFKRRAKL